MSDESRLNLLHVSSKPAIIYRNSGFISARNVRVSINTKFLYGEERKKSADKLSVRITVDWCHQNKVYLI